MDSEQVQLDVESLAVVHFEVDLMKFGVDLVLLGIYDVWCYLRESGTV